MEKTTSNQRNEQLLQLIQGYRERMADGMPRSIARLYSQHVRLAQGQTTQPWWTQQESNRRLLDAVRLFEAAFYEMRENQTEDSGWKSSLRRSGEILEWLSHEEMGTDFAPTYLLAAAAYQMAGYAARAYNIIKGQTHAPGEDSKALRGFLQADFQALLVVLVTNWLEASTDQVEYAKIDGESWSREPSALANWVNELVIGSTLSAMGVLTAQMRWGDENRVQLALKKLSSIANLLVHSDDPYTWLLARACFMTGEAYIQQSLRQSTGQLRLNGTGRRMLERYLRLSYASGRTIAWPSQALGIERLRERQSFALCTPTGSGKTTVAEI